MTGPAGLDRIEALLAQYRQPAIMLHRPYPPVKLPRVNSHLGGLPALPSGYDWPRTNGGTPLHFLAQIDCAELPQVELRLPRDGVLFFFARIDEEMAWWEVSPQDACRVLFAPAVGEVPCAPPQDLPALMDGWTGFERTFHLEGDPPFRVYPSWPVVAFPIQSWPDHSALPDQTGFDLDAYQQLVERARGVEAIRVTGSPTQTGYSPDWWRLLFEGDGNWSEPFPQLWVMVDRIARYLAVWARSTEEKEHRRSKKYYDLEQLREIGKAAMAWVELAAKADLASPPDEALRLDFVKWLDAFRQNESNSIRAEVSKALGVAMSSAIQYTAMSEEAAARVPWSYYRDLEGSHLPVRCFRDNMLADHPNANLNAWRLLGEFHQMLGRAGSSQTARSVETDDVMLLQLISDQGVGFMFGDYGEVEFWISKDDLASRRFGRAWATNRGG